MSVTFAGVGAITLTNPQYGDSNFSDIGHVTNRTRGGLIVQAAIVNTGQLAKRRQVVTWRHLSKDKIDELLGFMLDNLGKFVTYDDFRSNQEEVIILTPDANFTTEGQELCDSAGGTKSITLELEYAI